MSSFERWVVFAVLFVGTYLLVCLLRAIHDAYRDD